VPLNDASGISRDVPMVVDLPNTPEMIEIGSDDKEPKDQLESDLEKEPEEEDLART